MFFRQLATKEATLSYFFGCATCHVAVAVDPVLGDEDWFIEPIATLEFVLPASWFGSDANAALIGRPAIDFQVAYERNWSTLAVFNYEQWTVGAAVKFGWRF